MHSHKWLVIAGAAMGFISVAAGAFGAHALKQKIDQEMLQVFEVGARYQMYHAIAMFLSAWVATLSNSAFAPWSGWLFFVGALIFSGSLYLLALTGIRLFGAVTPIGGVLLLMGWGCLAVAAFKSL